MSADGKPPVLIAYDGSDFAKNAVREAAKQLGAGRRALLLTVFEPFQKIPFFGAAGAPIESSTVEELLAGARKGAQKIAEEGSKLAREQGFEVEPIVAEGVPVWNEIVAAAEEHAADLIVVGSRGLSGIKHVALGSVAAAVVQHSRRSALGVDRPRQLTDHRARAGR